MPAKPHEFLIRNTKKRDSLVAAVANIVHAAGVTVSLSLETAQKIVSTSETFFFGEPREIKSVSLANCLHLREIRRHIRRKREEARMTDAPAPECTKVSFNPIITNPTDNVQSQSQGEEPTEDQFGFGAWEVIVRAELETNVGASTPQEAITIAAKSLHKNIVYARATQVDPL